MGIFFRICLLFWAGSVWAKGPKIFAYYSYDSFKSRQMEILGKVASKSTSMRRIARLLDYDTREMIITAWMQVIEGVRVGDRVVIIEKDPNHTKYKNGYVIGEAEIYSIFKTQFQGWMIRARGNLSMVKKNHFIARPFDQESKKLAWIEEKRGDKHIALGNESEAFTHYRKSIENDPNRAEVYISLSKVAEKSGRKKEALLYTREAWKNLRRFQDMNQMLSLLGRYLRLEQEHLKEENKLSGLVELLKESRYFQKRLNQHKASLTKESLARIKKQGLFEAVGQEQLGRLYSSIFLETKKLGLRRSLSMLSKAERNILIAPIEMPYFEKKKAYPKKSWYEAYFDASLYHHQLAFNLNPQRTESGYYLVKILSEKLSDSIPKKKRDGYIKLVKYYGKRYLDYPRSRIRIDQVRRLVASVSQDS